MQYNTRVETQSMTVSSLKITYKDQFLKLAFNYFNRITVLFDVYCIYSVLFMYFIYNLII